MTTSRQKIIFLGGWGRSGSTVLANVLGSTPGIASVGEIRYLWDRGILENKKCGCGTAVRECRFWLRTFQSAGLILSPELARRMTVAIGSRAVFRQLAAMLTGRDAAYRRKRTAELAILRRIYHSAFSTANVGTIVDSSKTPPYALNLLGSPEFDVYFIHLVRDPRAVAHSWARRKDTGEGRGIDLFPKYSALRAAAYWVIFNSLGLLMKRRMPGRFLLVRYEDFCLRPQETTRGILEFCGLPQARPAWAGSSTALVREQHSVSGNPSRFSTGRVSIEPDDEWMHAMRLPGRWLVTALCAPWLRSFGYSLRRPAGARVFSDRADPNPSRDGQGRSTGNSDEQEP